MHREDVQRLEGHGVVAADHVLVAQKVGEVGYQGVPDPLVLFCHNRPAAQFQPQQLPLVEHLPVAAVSPAQQSAGLVAGWNRVIGHEAGVTLCKLGDSLIVACQVGGVGPLEEAAGVSGLACPAVVLHGKHPVAGRPVIRAGVG